MLRSLLSGVSGVKAHHTMLDVTGNNISNVNTSGFKKSTTVFQDLLYQTSQGATSPTEGRGGVNALQIGLGVQVAAVETIHTQGQVEYTSNPLDMAIQGDGYYVVTSGTQTLYTRAGNFTLDENGDIVQSGTSTTTEAEAVVTSVRFDDDGIFLEYDGGEVALGNVLSVE